MDQRKDRNQTAEGRAKEGRGGGRGGNNLTAARRTFNAKLRRACLRTLRSRWTFAIRIRAPPNGKFLRDSFFAAETLLPGKEEM